MSTTNLLVDFGFFAPEVCEKNFVKMDLSVYSKHNFVGYSLSRLLKITNKKLYNVVPK